jgi:hypothetical protein
MQGVNKASAWSSREELPPWLVDGILPMEDVIEAYYERQGVGDIYEEQVPKK